MTKKSVATQKFISLLEKYKKGNSRWSSNLEASSIRDIIDSFSNKELKEIFSDPYWIRYPVYKYHNTSAERGYGGSIRNFVVSMIKYNLPQKDILYSHSNGIFARFAIDLATSDVKHRLLRRLTKSSDSRVRKQAAKLLPVKDAIHLLKDPDSSIRCAVKSRLLNEPKYIHLLDDGKDPWYLSQAYPSFNLSSERVKAEIERIRQTPPLNGRKYWLNYSNQRILANLLSRLTNQELLFYVDLNGDEVCDDIKNLFRVRLGC